MSEQLSAFFYRLKIKNKTFTLIARDCIGGVVYHQLKLRFLTPTINLFFTPEDFNYFCLYLKDYIDADLVEFKDERIPYPVGLLTPNKTAKTNRQIKVHFMHYDSFELAFNKWEERKKRINWDNIYVVSSFCYPKEVATLSDQLIQDWNAIKYPKVVLVDKNYGFDNEYIIQKPEQCEEYAWLLFSPDQKKPWKRTFNEFNFIKFLNKKSEN